MQMVDRPLEVDAGMLYRLIRWTTAHPHMTTPPTHGMGGWMVMR